MLAHPRRLASVCMTLVLGSIPGFSQTQEPKKGEGMSVSDELDLLMLLNTPVVSASKTSEKLSEAPATVIVISRDDLDRRGYAQLSDVLDDLPGMEIIRANGDTQLKNYWRGFRNTIGEPFLVMVDGVVFNHLYFNTADTPLVAVPLSNIDHIEVVYGPASSVYGANAFMGVINVITQSEKAVDGSSQHVSLTGGTLGRRIVDATYAYQNGDFRLHLSVRMDNGLVDNRTSENYEFTKNAYYANRQIWGGFVDNPSLGGRFQSEWRHRAMDFRAYVGATEVGFQYLLSDAGYGLVYPGDLVQNNASWARPDLSFHLRHTETLTQDITASTLIRYRESGVDPKSYFVDAYDNGLPDGYVAAYSYWQTKNSSWTLAQDFDIRFSKALGLTTGFKYERKDLQKAYDIAGEALDPAGNPYTGPLDDPTKVPAWAHGAYIPVKNFATNLGLYPFPTAPVPVPGYNNRIFVEDRGVYAQLKWRLDEQHQLNLGLRADHNSAYGSSTTFRGGYVGSFGAWGIKALFGQAFQEPAPRVLYGGWGGSGADPALSPEKSNTLEVSGTYTEKRFSTLLSLWRVRDTDTIVTVKPGTDKGKGAQNLGERDVTGLDLHVQFVLPKGAFKQVKAWAYYSHYFKTNEEKYAFNKVTSAFDHLGTGQIGDLAKNKFWVGLTAVFDDHFDLTLRGRHISDRRAVDTNVRNDLPGSPVTVVPSYSTLDLTLNAKFQKIGFALKVDNLTDKGYFHPGIRSANAGFIPGSFAVDGSYHGGSSYNYFNSLLPQPGRNIQFTLKFLY